MFASILYIPEYQQVVLGYSPTKSGLALLPLVLGIFTASITSGRLITHWGRYKIFPIIGTTLLGIGIWLFSHVGINTDYWVLASWMVVIGLGLGQLMQVPTLAVQNSVERKRMGVATSATVFFRQMGASLGGAIFGTILVARLTKHLEELLPGSGSIAAKSIHAGTQHLAHAPAMVRHDVLLAFVQSFHDMFLIAIPFVIAAFMVALFLRETPLRTSTKDTPESASPLMTD
jgi:MFS family permease